MIIVNREIPPLSEFGIGIPVSDERDSKSISYLSSLSGIGKAIDPLLIENREDSLQPGISKGDILRAHDPVYTEGIFGDRLEMLLIKAFELIDEQGNYNRYDPERAHYPLDQLLSALMAKTRGSCLCTEQALDTGFAFYFGGGFHHAHSDFGHGFCLINDIVIAAKRLIHLKRVKTVWIIDIDAHRGDGTAALTQDDPSIRTLSIHMASGWPLDRPEYLPSGKRHPSFIPGDIDIPIFEGEEERYNRELSRGLRELNGYLKPDLAIVVAGSDPYERDTLPSSSKLNLSLEQMLERDEIVYHFLSEQKIPSAYLMAGGYSPDSWEIYARFLEMVLTRRSGSDFE
jgi:acetoin utilization deacetylase AcuC-like enzyme